MNTKRFKLRWTLGGLMLVVAVVALPLGWYAHTVRQEELRRAALDAERNALLAEAEQLLRKLEEENRLEQERIAEAIERARTPQPPPSVASIPGQVKNIVKLLEERQKLEEKSKRDREATARRIFERMEKAKNQAPPLAAEPVETPR